MESSIAHAVVHPKKKQTFRGVIAGLTIVVLLVMLVACGDGGNTPPPRPTPSPTPTATPIPTPPLTMTPDERADYLLGYMTQAEKLQLVHGLQHDVTNLPGGVIGFIPGIPRLHIPEIRAANGPVGVGLEYNLGEATALPSSMASAAAWDLDLAYDYGDVIGSDMRAKGLNFNLGGNVNLSGREPRVGRAFEMKGEDPILAGRINAQHVRAIQDHNVIADIKHFALNDQETGREHANVIVNERAARETDLLAFEIGVKDSGVQSVMCAYNLVNGTYSCENDHLLNDILKDDWGFQGFVVSDWWVILTDSATAANAGLDLEMPGPDRFGNLGADIQQGRVTQARLDNMVHRILRAMMATGVYDNPPVQGTLDAERNLAIAQRVAEQGTVLLKNNGWLPLNAGAIGSCIAVIGRHADIGVISGGGSARVWPIGGPALTQPVPNPPGWGLIIWNPSSPLEAIQAKVPSASMVQFNDGTSATAAATLAGSCDAAIVFAYEWQSEAMDLPTLNLSQGQDALISAVAAANPNTTVVLQTGGAVAMPWINEVGAVLAAWFPGQRGAEAIANILFGDVNPSGKLPITFPVSHMDLPHPTITGQNGTQTVFDVNYTEGLQVGYKWFNQQGMTPLFPFGYGLSYSSFGIAIYPHTLSNNVLSIPIIVHNNGSRDGASVVQFYLSMPAALNEPPRRLIGWEKVFVPHGEQREVTVTIDAASSAHPFSYWDETSGNWQIGDGEYTLYVGLSSGNLLSLGEITATGGVLTIPNLKQFENGGIVTITDRQ